MGRLFVTELEGPVYTCKYCPDVHIAAYPPPNRGLLRFKFPASFGKLLYFFRCFSVVIGTHEVRITINGVNNQTHVRSFKEVFCVACGSHLGFYTACANGKWRYNEGNFYINRFKLHGPPEGSDDENPEA